MVPEEYDLYLHNQLHRKNAIPKDTPFKKTIGEPVLGLLRPTLPFKINHPAILLLDGYVMEGFPINCGPDWTQEHLYLMLECGPHKS